MTHRDIVIAAVAYALGSVPFGLLLGLWRRGEDIRRRGSGNIGAANVFREMGIALGVATLILDAAKGTVAVLLAVTFASSGAVGAAALGAVLGHLYPPWLRFRGGKGVATAAGAFGPLSPAALLVALMVFVALVGRTRRIAVGSMAAAIVFAVLDAWGPFAAETGGYAWAAAGLILWRHRDNLARLLSGEEPEARQRGGGAAGGAGG